MRPLIRLSCAQVPCVLEMRLKGSCDQDILRLKVTSDQTSMCSNLALGRLMCARFHLSPDSSALEIPSIESQVSSKKCDQRMVST